MVSMHMVVLPVDLSPMISSRCPLPIGIIASMAFIPVWRGSCTDFLFTTPGAIFSIGDLYSYFMGPFPSRGLPSGSMTLPMSPSPTGASRILPVLLTTEPSFIPLSLPRIIIPTLSSSRLKARPITPLSNSTSSLAITLSSPYALATPSPT
ncbi:hypothetical protein HRbin13_00716 [bacterium HR13]|nr:hypothetical protein HRbin13_00716 [bacterium HR13]